MSYDLVIGSELRRRGLSMEEVLVSESDITFTNITGSDTWTQELPDALFVVIIEAWGFENLESNEPPMRNVFVVTGGRQITYDRNNMLQLAIEGPTSATNGFVSFVNRTVRVIESPVQIKTIGTVNEYQFNLRIAVVSKVAELKKS
jgi:hypothetical protein